MDSRTKWSDRLRRFLPSFVQSHPALHAFAGRGAFILHGSTCRGVDDAFSDLDLYLVLLEPDLHEFDRASSTRFLELQLDGKPGHISVSSLQTFEAQVDGCTMSLISELRTSELIAAADGLAAALLAKARRPMRPQVRAAYFFHHYFQMRNFHRAADNPMARGDAVAVMMAVSQTIAHALRAALILHGEPYPYEKWLRHEAARYATGQALLGPIETILDAVAGDVLRRRGPERENPISNALRAMRTILIDAARLQGIDEPWLVRWWLYIPQAEAATVGIQW